METQIVEKSPAYLFMKKFVIKYVKENLDVLYAKYRNDNGGFDDKILSDLRKGNNILEWLLGEILNQGEFYDLGYVLENDWKEIDGIDVHITIYKIDKKYGAKEIILLYCVSNYPSKISDFNFNNIKILKERYNCKVGFSDHSIDNQVVAAAIVAGAEVIEKHIALEGQKKGFDLAFSLKGKEIKEYAQVIKDTSLMMGKKYFFRNKSENHSLQFRRSIYAVSDIKKGEKFTKKNIRVIRPGFGISPIYFEKLINKKSPFDIKMQAPIKKSLLRALQIKSIY